MDRARPRFQLPCPVEPTDDDAGTYGVWVVRTAGEVPPIPGCCAFRAVQFLAVVQTRLADPPLCSVPVGCPMRRRCCLQYFSNMLLSMAFVIQGEEPHELPECVIGGGQLHRVNLDQPVCLD